jgi:hypothetical protein
VREVLVVFERVPRLEPPPADDAGESISRLDVRRFHVVEDDLLDAAAAATHGARVEERVPVHVGGNLLDQGVDLGVEGCKGQKTEIEVYHSEEEEEPFRGRKWTNQQLHNWIAFNCSFPLDAKL